MIYEFRTYTLHPRTQPEFLEHFGAALPKREQFSKLAAMWTSEIGPLNQVIHVWGYDNVAERTRIRAEAVKAGIWPPATSEFIQDMTSQIFEPLPYSPALTPSNHGPYFEMRTYTLKAGGIPKMAESWGKHLPGRLKLSPLIGVFTSEIGALNQWVHIWAYKSLDERVAVRKAAMAKGVWPPPNSTPMVRQETKILLAAPFSPVK